MTSEPATDPLRERIVDGVLAAVAEEGFEGATIRRVAARAGCSAGAVQKRFPTRATLLEAAFVVMAERSLIRLVADPGTRSGTLAERQAAAIRQTLPLDAERRNEALVWTSYLLRAAIEPALRGLPQELDAHVHAALAEELAAAQAARGLRADVDTGALADAIIALADGLAVRMLYAPPADHARLLRALDTGLDALLAI